MVSNIDAIRTLTVNLSDLLYLTAIVLLRHRIIKKTESKISHRK